MQKLLIFLGLMALANASFRVYNGDVLKDWRHAQFKYIVLLYNEDTGKLCTGSLAKSDKVVTAGHCTCGVSAYLGITDLNGKSQASVKIAKLTPSPEYQPFCMNEEDEGLGGFDIGVVKLLKPVNLRKDGDLELAKLSYDMQPSVGETITLMGYGFGKVDDADSAGFLRVGKESVAQCVEPFKSQKAICGQPTPGFKMQRSMPGDSGAPAIVSYRGRQVVCGVVSGTVIVSAIKTSRTGQKERIEVPHTVYASTTGNKKFLKKQL